LRAGAAVFGFFGFVEVGVDAGAALPFAPSSGSASGFVFAFAFLRDLSFFVFTWSCGASPIPSDPTIGLVVTLLALADMALPWTFSFTGALVALAFTACLCGGSISAPI
jgi:hypothetical protein